MASFLARTFQPVVNFAWGFNRKSKRAFPPNPHLTQSRSFFSNNVEQVLNGWTIQSTAIDQYLMTELTALRARSRESVRQDPYAKRYTHLMKVNIIGDKGVQVQSRLKKSNGEMDVKANEAIENALTEWMKKSECDYEGKLNFVDMQNLLIKNVSQDGEYVVRIYEGRSQGRFGIRLKVMDAEELDTTKNMTLANGNVVRLGVEYDAKERVVFYHFREVDQYGNYQTGEEYKVAARYILHGFLSEYPQQSRGIPWTSASLGTLKQLSRYNEAAITAARYGAAKMLFLSSKDAGGEEDMYTGTGVDALGNNVEHVDPGTIQDIGNRSIETFDPKYPHEMYPSFNKSLLRMASSGLNVSYYALASDLEDVNYSSIRAGVLEDRDMYKTLQGWFIRDFVSVVVERWFAMSYITGAIKIGSYSLSRPVTDYMASFSYQPRRWAWTDPQKDTKSNIDSINANLKSRSQVIRDQGDDPEAVFAEIQRETELLKEAGIMSDENSEGEQDAKPKD